MNPKHSENSIRKYDEKSLDKLQYKVVFNDPAYAHVFKKTEKIISALYLITNLISDTEPIKYQIRKVSLKIMSDILALKKTANPQPKQSFTDLLTAYSEIISLLKIAHIAGNVSAMNYSVAQREITLLMTNIDALHSDDLGNGAVVLPQDFFDTPVVNTPAVNTPVFNPKGHYKTPSVIKDNRPIQAPKDNLKDSRKDTMLSLLKSGKPMGIKDFAREIKGCSEKTIQRELLSMVESGVLKKTGERRWSLYSLA